jgi:hypothetical protein
MPMLDDDEFCRVMALLPIGKGGEDLVGFTIDEARLWLRAKFTPMLAEYERITGLRETNPNVVFHHRLSQYGPPCRYCGMPLRTPKAQVCGFCMKPVSGQ